MSDFVGAMDMRRRGGGMRRGGFEMRSERGLAMPELRLLLLSLLGPAERHGYDLIRQIKALTAGRYAPSPGMVYPALTELADAGMISRASDGARKPFSITAAGKAELAAAGDTLRTIDARLEALGPTTRQHNPAIRRAMTNLDQVIANILANPVADRIDAIVELIDRTAREIERSGSPEQA